MPKTKGVGMKRRALALVLAAALALGVAPTAMFAADETGGSAETTVSQSAISVADETSLRTTIANAQPGDTIQLANDIAFTIVDENLGGSLKPYITIQTDITLDLNGHSIGWNQQNIPDSLDSTPMFFSVDGANVTITGNGSLSTEAGSNDSYGMNIVNGGSVTVVSGTFAGGTTAIQVTKGTLTVLGGTFKQAQTISEQMPSYAKYVINCIDANFQTGTARIYLKGGSFCYDFSNSPEGEGTSYIAEGYQIARDTDGMYKVTPKASMSQNTAVSDDSTTAETVVGGNYTGTGSTVSIGAKAEDSANVDSAKVTVASNSLDTIAKNEPVQSVIIDTNIGTVSIDKQAWTAMTSNATTGTDAVPVVNDVVLTFGKNAEASTADSTVYDVTAVDSAGTEVFGSENAQGLVTITVPFTGEYAEVYYLAPDGAVPVDCTLNTEADALSWTVDHFSSYAVRSTVPVASTVSNGVSATHSTLDEAIAAVADNGGTIELLKDASMAQKATIKSDVTINGNGHIISGVANDTNVNFTIESGDFSINNVTLDNFGSSAATDSGIAVIKVNDSAGEVSVKSENVKIKNFCRSAYDIRSGAFSIKDGEIDCGSGNTSKLTKGIVAGLGSTGITGNITGTTITNSNSNFSDWSTAGIEIYKGAAVTIAGCNINNVDNGIHVDNYYDASGDVQGASVTITDTSVTASNDAIRSYGKGDAANGDTATIVVNGGTLVGDIAIIDGTATDGSSANKEIISVENAVVNGSIDNNNGSMAFANSTIKNEDSTVPTNVTFVNTTVNGKDQNSATSGVALLRGTVYATLEEAVNNVESGDTIYLLNDAIVNGKDVANNNGILTFNGVQNVTIDGNGKTITAENINTNAPSMINIQYGASVTVKNLNIDGENTVKHGLNVYDNATLTVQDVIITKCKGYAIVNNSSNVTVNGLVTSDNDWGGINVDNSHADGSGSKSTLTVITADIREESSIVFEKKNKDEADATAEIHDGSFKSIVDKTESGKKLDLTITGGTFNPVEDVANTININDYVAAGLEWNPSTGTVQPDTPDTPDTPVTPGKPSYAVNVAKPENGSISAKPAKAKEGEKVTITVTPDKGFELVELTVTDKDGKAVKATLNDDGTYTFTMPKGAVSIAATFDCDGGELCPTHPFTDVDQDKWYHDAVDWAVENGVMRGYDNTTLFGPEDSHTREQAATVMWNIMGEGDLEAPAADLADVIQTEWYAPYVNWAYEAGIMRGYTGTDDFGVGDALSREQFAQIIVNATKADLSSVDTSVLDDFEDPDSVSPWAEKTMAWAVENGIIHGVDDTKLQGDRSITRAEMATMVKNAVDEGIISLAE